MRFPRILGLSDEKVRPLQVALTDTYANVQLEDAQEIQIGPDGLRTAGSDRIYRFRTQDEDWIVSLTSSFVAVETTAYKGFRDFFGRWERIVSLSVKHFELSHQDRLGLRFINEIELPRDGLDAIAEVVRPELLGIAGKHERTRSLIRSLQEMRLRQPDGAFTLRHGYTAQDHPLYLLDFDYYDDSPKALDLDEQKKTLINFDHATFDLFKWLVTAEAFASFKPVERADAESPR